MTLNKLEVKYLSDVPEYLPTLARWTLDAWLPYDPTLNLADITRSLEEKLHKDRIPLAFVAVLNSNEPIGMINIKQKIKLHGYDDRNLWLGSFWVKNDLDNHDAGKHLLERVYAKAKELGYEEISTFESDPATATWLVQHGWHTFAIDKYQDHHVTLLEYILLN